MAKTPRITAARQQAAERLGLLVQVDRETAEFVLGFHEDGAITEEVARDAAWDVAHDRAARSVRADAAPTAPPAAAEAVPGPAADAAAPAPVADPDPAGTAPSAPDGAEQPSDDPDQPSATPPNPSDDPVRRLFGDSAEPVGDSAEQDVGGPAERARGATIVDKRYKLEYGESQSCGDLVSRLIADLVQVRKAKGKGTTTDEQALLALAAQNDIDPAGQWAGLNVGQWRMNVSNVLRGRMRRGLPVLFGDVRTCLAEEDAAWPGLSVQELAERLGLLDGTPSNRKAWLAGLGAIRARRLKAEAKADAAAAKAAESSTGSAAAEEEGEPAEA